MIMSYQEVLYIDRLAGSAGVKTVRQAFLIPNQLGICDHRERRAGRIRCPKHSSTKKSGIVLLTPILAEQAGG